MPSGSQPMQKRQKQSAYESEQQAEASPNKPQKRGRKPNLTPDEKRIRRMESNKKYRNKIADKTETLQEKNQDLEKENEELKKNMGAQQREINVLKEQLSEINTQADKLRSQVSDNVNVVKMAHIEQETGMQQLQEQILNQAGQEHDLENSNFDIPMDLDYFDNLTMKMMEHYTKCPDPLWSKTKEGLSFGEGSSCAKAISPLRETLNFEGFLVQHQNFDTIQEIFSKYPAIASGNQFCLPATKTYFINTLAEIYKMAKREKLHNLEEINLMDDSIEDLKHAGFEISWLKDMVLERRKEFEEEEEIRITEDKLKCLKESKSKRIEERKSERQKPM